MYLQLADNHQPAYLGQQDLYPDDIMEYMIAIPDQYGNPVWVREDQLDHLPDSVLYALMQQQPGMSGIKDWFARRKERKEERRADKEQDRQWKRDRKAARQDEWANRKRRREERHQGRQSSRASRIERRMSKDPDSGARTAENIFGGIANTVGGIFGGRGGGGDDMPMRGAEDYFPQFTGGASFGVSKWWQNPWIIGLGALAVVGTTIVLVRQAGKKK